MYPGPRRNICPDSRAHLIRATYRMGIAVEPAPTDMHTPAHPNLVQVVCCMLCQRCGSDLRLLILKHMVDYTVILCQDRFTAGHRAGQHLNRQNNPCPYLLTLTEHQSDAQVYIPAMCLLATQPPNHVDAFVKHAVLLCTPL